MKKLIGFVVLVVLATDLLAQDWDFHIGTGATFGRLVPEQQSTARSSVVRYGFAKSGIYLSPEVGLTVSPRSKFTIGYQFSDNKAGIKFVTPSHVASATEFDIIDLHNFSVGYAYRQMVLHEHIEIDAFAKMGIAYGYMDGMGGGGSAGSYFGYSGMAGSGSERITAFEVMPDFWSPTNSIGFSVSPVDSKRKFIRKLTLDVSATICWKNPYTGYSKVYYDVAEDNFRQSGVAQYQGKPLLLQIGFNYRLFRFGGKSPSDTVHKTAKLRREEKKNKG